MKKCLVVTGGSIDISFVKDFLQNRRYDWIVAVDAGLEILSHLHIVPDEVVGDLDSVDPLVLREYKDNPSVAFEIHKPEKDETDTELALLTAAKCGYNSVDLLGALGGRMDHAKIGRAHV